MLNHSYVLTLFRMGIFRAAHGWRGAKRPPSLKSVTHILQWNLAQLYLTLRTSKKNMNHVTCALSSADISIFSPEISRFCYIKKYRYRLHFSTKFPILLAFLEFLKVCLINRVIILMMSAKVATPGLLKITVFWNKGYEIIISVDDVINKILSYNLNYIVDVFMWPKFGNCSISMREVITTSIL